MEAYSSIMLNTSEKQRNVLLDIVRFLSAILIVVLHSGVDLGIFSPILRIPVPIFFLSSGYFLFKKQKNMSKEEANRTLIRYIKRNMQLYMFWFILLLPITLLLRDWFSGSIVVFVQSFLFNSTFRASWFLMAMNIGAIFVSFLTRRIGTKRTVAIGLGIYLVCCLFSNYYNLLLNCELLLDIYQAYLSVFRSLVNSFPVAFFWLALGKYLAETEVIPKLVGIKYTLLFLPLLLLEGWLVDFYNLAICDDCYVMLIPVCVALFQFSLHHRIEWKPNFRMAHMSTIIYAVHASIVSVLEGILNYFGIVSVGLVFVLTISSCIIGSYLIFTLEKYKYLKWLKYAY